MIKFFTASFEERSFVVSNYLISKITNYGKKKKKKPESVLGPPELNLTAADFKKTFRLLGELRNEKVPVEATRVKPGEAGEEEVGGGWRVS